MVEIPGPTRAKTGMWLFLLTEIMLFGGLFLLYMAYRMHFPLDFHTAAQEMDLPLGTLNTAILITSSLFVALAVVNVRDERRARARLFLLIAAVLGLAFLCVKAVEWSAKFRHGLYPGAEYLDSRNPGFILYFGLYFVMTGLHALHVAIGIGVLGVLAAQMRSGTDEPGFPLVDNAGLYWHLVDIIWIFLFPLFYLIR